MQPPWIPTGNQYCKFHNSLSFQGTAQKGGNRYTLMELQGKGSPKGKFSRDGIQLQIHYRAIFTLIFKLSIKIHSMNQKISVLKYTCEILLVCKYCSSCSLSVYQEEMLNKRILWDFYGSVHSTSQVPW